MNNVSIKITRAGLFEIKTVEDLDTRKTTTTIRSSSGDIVARGYAKHNPIDQYDPEVGEVLSLGRALAKFGKKLANLAEARSVSPGLYRSRQRREDEIYALGSATLGQMQYIAQLQERDARKKVSNERKAQHIATNNAPQEPTTAPATVLNKEVGSETPTKVAFGGAHV